MKLRTLMAAAAAVSLAASPALAQPSVNLSRVSAPVSNENQLEGGSGIFIAILAAAAVIAGVIIAADDPNDDPVSP